MSITNSDALSVDKYGYTSVSLDDVSGIASQVPVPICYQPRVKVPCLSHVYRCEVVDCSAPPPTQKLVRKKIFIESVGKHLAVWHCTKLWFGLWQSEQTAMLEQQGQAR